MISNSYLLIIKLDCLFIVCSLFTKTFLQDVQEVVLEVVDPPMWTGRFRRLAMNVLSLNYLAMLILALILIRYLTNLYIEKLSNLYITKTILYINCVIDSDRFVNLKMAYA